MKADSTQMGKKSRQKIFRDVLILTVVSKPSFWNFKDKSSTHLLSQGKSR